MTEKKRFYVYHLIDPRTDQTFYVGKGQAYRIDAHENEAGKGRQSRKCETIREIWAAGLQVRKVKVQWFDCEAAAYEFEAQEIDGIGLENLTNVIPGGGTVRRAQAKAKKATELTIKGLEKIGPQLANYFRITAAGGSVTIAGEDIKPVMHAFVASVVRKLGVDAFVSVMAKHNVGVEIR